jgi:toluene monooxygenase system ferredoxin subunit
MKRVDVAGADDLWRGEMRAIRVGQRPVLLVNVEGCVRAYEDRCAHQGIALSAGRLNGCVLTCSAHDWQYDVCTGRGINPSSAALKPYPVEVQDGRILVCFDE